MSANPWRATVFVGFEPFQVHPWMRLFFRRQKGFDHCWIMRPLGDDRWIFIDWSLQGLCVRVISRELGNRVLNRVATQGSMLKVDANWFPPAHWMHSILPTSCAGMMRQVLGLPVTWRFWHSPASLWCELRQRGAEVVLSPEQDPLENADERWWRRWWRAGSDLLLQHRA